MHMVHACLCLGQDEAFLDLTALVEAALPKRDPDARRVLCEQANSRADTLCVPPLDHSTLP
jgi:hypothetical protein